MKTFTEILKKHDIMINCKKEKVTFGKHCTCKQSLMCSCPIQTTFRDEYARPIILFTDAMDEFITQLK